MLKFSTAVQSARAAGLPLVALESTIIAHGLPWPQNLEVAKELEAIVREEGAEPATIALNQGKICIGLDAEELEALASPETEVAKVSRRDMALIDLGPAGDSRPEDMPVTVEAQFVLIPI